MELNRQPRTRPEITWTPLAEAAAPQHWSAYAEFRLRASGVANRQRALAGVVAHMAGAEGAAALLSAAIGRAPRRSAGNRAMSAHELADTYRKLLTEVAPGAQWDAVNARPVADDHASEAEAGFGFLDDRVLPDDPAHAALIGIIDDSIPFAHELLTVRGEDGGRRSRVASVWMQGARSLTAAAPSTPADRAPPALRRALGFDRDPPPVGADLTLGRELRGGQIDTLLAALGTPMLPDEGALYRAAGAIDLARPSPPGWARKGSHGAAVAALAAGFASDDAQARRFPVIAVCLPPEVTRDTRGSLGPFFIVLAYLHILNRAERLCRFIEARRNLAKGSVRLPVAINLSYGITAGPKDGQSLLERFQDALSDDHRCLGPDLGPLRCILPAGNHRMAQLHAQLQAGAGEGTAGATDRLRWVLRPDDPSANAIEIWGPREEPGGEPGPRLEVALRPPGSPDFVPASFPGDGWGALSVNGTEAARLRRTRHATPARVRDFVSVILHPTVPRQLGDPVAMPGEWQLRVSGPIHGPIDVTLHRDESLSGFRSGARQSVLVDKGYLGRKPGGLPMLDDPWPPTSPLRRRGTLNAYATGQRIVRVGGAVEDVRHPAPAATDGADGDLAAVTLAAASDAAYSGMDDEGFGGSLVAAAELPGLAASAPCGARWKASCDRSPVREGLIVPGILSGSRQILRGTSLAAPQVTRTVAHELAEQSRRQAEEARRAAKEGDAAPLGGDDFALPPRARQPQLAPMLRGLLQRLRLVLR